VDDSVVKAGVGAEVFRVPGIDPVSDLLDIRRRHGVPVQDAPDNAVSKEDNGPNLPLSLRNGGERLRGLVGEAPKILGIKLVDVLQKPLGVVVEAAIAFGDVLE
jgi:hypothetical protein